MKYRIKFSKYDIMIFIGHLDVMRFFQKAFRRSGLPISYSTGFSPHQIMSFAQPLGVGVYSTGEYFDAEFDEAVDEAVIKERLQSVMERGIDILDVKALPENAKNAMASIAAASYSVSLRNGHFPALSLTERFREFMEQETILYEKETKRSKKELNLKDSVFRYATGSGDSVELLLDASSSGNLNPYFVMDAYFQYLGHTCEKLDFVITRKDIYYRDADGALRFLSDL